MIFQTSRSRVRAPPSAIPTYTVDVSFLLPYLVVVGKARGVVVEERDFLSSGEEAWRTGLALEIRIYELLILGIGERCTIYSSFCFSLFYFLIIRGAHDSGGYKERGQRSLGFRY